MKSKYVSYEAGWTENALVFSESVGHDEIAAMIKNTYPGSKILGAGFVSVEVTKDLDVKVKAYGKSTSLKLESRPEDTKLIQFALGLVGF